MFLARGQNKRETVQKLCFHFQNSTRNKMAFVGIVFLSFSIDCLLFFIVPFQYLTICVESLDMCAFIFAGTFSKLKTKNEMGAFILGSAPCDAGLRIGAARGQCRRSQGRQLFVQQTKTQARCGSRIVRCLPPRDLEPKSSEHQCPKPAHEKKYKLNCTKNDKQKCTKNNCTKNNVQRFCLACFACCYCIQFSHVFPSNLCFANIRKYRNTFFFVFRFVLQ